MTKVHLSSSTWDQPLPSGASSERAALVERLADRIVALSSGRIRIAIDGLTAAGKTSLGHELAEQVARRGRQVLRASLDDFKKPWRDRHLYDRESGEGYYRNAYDYDAVHRLLLEPAAPTGSGKVALCGIDPLTQIDHSATLTEAAADAVLIVDGVFAFRPELNPVWDLRIWLEITPETSVRRGAERDQDWAGSEAEAYHRDRYLPAERLYVAEADPAYQADVVIDNTDFHQPRLLTITKGVEYGSQGKHLDLYEPDGDDLPVVLLWHGRGPDERDVLAGLARAVAADGAAVVVPDYRSDAEDAGRTHLLESISYARDYAGEHRQIILAGWSYGGKAALGVATRPDVPDGWRPAAVVGIGSRYDTPAALHDLGKAKPIPVHLIHGTADTVVPADSSRSFAEALAEHGWPVTCTELETDHAGVVMTMYDPTLARCRPVLDGQARTSGEATARRITQAVTSL